MKQGPFYKVNEKGWMDKRHGPDSGRYYPEAVAKTLVYDLAVARVLDLGCGACNFANSFRMYNCDVVAVDNSPFAEDTARSDIEFIQHDLCTSLNVNGSFDLVFCMEVIEHIDAKYEDTVLDNIVKHASKWIAFTGAGEDQTGVDHINCRPLDYWEMKFEALGFDSVPAEKLKKEWRKYKVKSWYEQNLLVLKKRKQ